jgi:hypothetical protein
VAADVENAIPTLRAEQAEVRSPLLEDIWHSVLTKEPFLCHPTILDHSATGVSLYGESEADEPRDSNFLGEFGAVAYPARSATTSTGTASLKLNSDPLGSPVLEWFYRRAR